jgi:hypothetical protein
MKKSLGKLIASAGAVIRNLGIDIENLGDALPRLVLVDSLDLARWKKCEQELSATRVELMRMEKELDDKRAADGVSQDDWRKIAMQARAEIEVHRATLRLVAWSLLNPRAPIVLKNSHAASTVSNNACELRDKMGETDNLFSRNDIAVMYSARDVLP